MHYISGCFINSRQRSSKSTLRIHALGCQPTRELASSTLLKPNAMPTSSTLGSTIIGTLVDKGRAQYGSTQQYKIKPIVTSRIASGLAMLRCAYVPTKRTSAGKRKTYASILRIHLDRHASTIWDSLCMLEYALVTIESLCSVSERLFPSALNLQERWRG